MTTSDLNSGINLKLYKQKAQTQMNSTYLNRHAFPCLRKATE